LKTQTRITNGYVEHIAEQIDLAIDIQSDGPPTRLTDAAHLRIAADMQQWTSEAVDHLRSCYPRDLNPYFGEFHDARASFAAAVDVSLRCADLIADDAEAYPQRGERPSFPPFKEWQATG